MIIDCHGHYTTAPEGAGGVAQPADRRHQGPGRRSRKSPSLKISDDELRESIEANQLKLMSERGAT